MSLEQLDNESEAVKEVYAYYGLAMYQAQCLEFQLCILLTIQNILLRKNVTRQQYDELLGGASQKTLGNLISNLRKVIVVPDNLEFNLKEALSKRNWLVHHYFRDRAVQFCKAEGRKLMIDELDKIIDRFENLDNQLTVWAYNLARKLNVTEEKVRKIAEDMLKD
jgi:hypothetical protein